MRALTRAQVQKLDRLAIEDLGIPGIVLMENAARSIATVILAQLRGSGRALPQTPTAIFCGGGNNGGDGYAVARHLHNAGVPVVLCAASDPRKLSGDAATQYAVSTKMGLPCYDVSEDEQLNAVLPKLAETQLLVDGLLGTGFSGELRPRLAAVIRACNELARKGKQIVAIDVPSGLDCDTGLPASETIRAEITVTLAAVKIGFLQATAREYLGRVLVGDIGTPPELIEYVAIAS